MGRSEIEVHAADGEPRCEIVDRGREAVFNFSSDIFLLPLFYSVLFFSSPKFSPTEKSVESTGSNAHAQDDSRYGSGGSFRVLLLLKDVSGDSARSAGRSLWRLIDVALSASNAVPVRLHNDNGEF